MKKGKTLLTAMIVVVIAAIYVVGFFLLWDYLSANGTIDELLDTNVLGSKPSAAPAINVDAAYSGTVISEEEEHLITDYFSFYYAALGTLRSADLSDHYVFQCCDELFDTLALDYEIALANGRRFDSCALGMNVRRRTVSDKRKTVEIKLCLSAQYSPDGFASPCKVNGEVHTFIIDRSSKKLKIKSHETDRISRRMTDAALADLLAEHKYTVSDLSYTYFPPYIRLCLDRLLDGAIPVYEATGSSLPVIGADGAEYDYDRSAAVSAALGGFELRRTSASYEENDANFTSWCIFDAGVPMDAQGSGTEQWKWYSEDINHERKKIGCTESWYDRAAFYDYIRNNEGFGLVAYEAPPDNGDKGDIVQIMHGSEPVLQCMITDVIKENDKVADYIVCTDIYSCVSLRSLAGTSFRLIHIIGYNTANI